MAFKIALFASGSGTNVENICNYFNSRSDISIPLIISNNPKAYVHSRAKKLNIPSFNLKNEEFRDGQKIISILKKHQIDLIVLAGFLLRIPTNIIEAYPDRIINIHPALLPKYGGKGMYGMHVHRAVKASNEKESGISIHYVNEFYDEGNIIFQAACELESSDTAEDIAQKIHILEQTHFPKVIDNLIKDIAEGK